MISRRKPRHRPGLFLRAAIVSTKPAEKSISGSGSGELSMPLTRGKVVGYDVAKMTFRFTMLNEGETVECEINSVAMDELGGKRGALPADRIRKAHRRLIGREVPWPLSAHWCPWGSM
jgi:hypothetical protein